MDVDLQDPPSLIPEMLEHWRKGAMIVNAVRSDRSLDSFAKRTTARAFYRIFNFLSDHQIPTDVGDFRLLDREVVVEVLRIGERSRLNKSIFGWVGYEAAEVSFERPQRLNGEASLTSLRLWKLALDGIFSASTTPLRVWTYVGLAMSFFALSYMVYIFSSMLISGREVPGYASTLIVILTFGGLNMIALGIIGEYVGRIYIETRQRPLYIVRSVKEVKNNGA
jgi:polyisoprenyl-phosphate glycosyltransferase